MSVIQRYRDWFEHEQDGNAKMLAMLESVPADRRDDPRFARACVLAAHLAACRENWLDRMVAGGESQVDWWPDSAVLESFRERYRAMEETWRQYLESIEDADLDADFEFPAGGGTYRWNIEGQIMQLIGHAFYHRGQIALLVGELGGEPVDTDYLYWAFAREPNRWGRIDCTPPTA